MAQTAYKGNDTNSFETTDLYEYEKTIEQSPKVYNYIALIYFGFFMGF